MSDQFTSIQWDRTEPEGDVPGDSNDHSQVQINSSINLIEEDQGQEQEQDDLVTTNTVVRGGNDSDSNPNEQIPPRDVYIRSKVSQPLKESDGQNFYISYLIETETNEPGLAKTKLKVRRRFSDSNFLYNCLANDFPTSIIPPLPNKQRLEYIKGDRFGEYFTTKRSIALNNFLNRISKHPLLKQAKIYHIFLEDSVNWNTFKQNLKISSNPNSTVGGGSTTSANANGELDSFSDYIMNAFKKPTYESENAKEFQEITDKSNKLQENINKIDKIYQRVVKRQSEISEDFRLFGDEFKKLNQILTEGSDTQFDKELSQQFTSFSENIYQISYDSFKLTRQVDLHYLTSLKDLDHYISQIKNMIKFKDSKLLDYEMLQNYLNKAIAEKNHLMNGNNVSGSDGAMNFISKKIGSLRGKTPGQTYSSGNETNDRINKLNEKIEFLEREVKETFELFHTFEKNLITEYQLFDRIKNDEITTNLHELSQYYLDYYNSVVNHWNDVEIPHSEHLTDELHVLQQSQLRKNLENISIDPKLDVNSKLFEHDDVRLNNDHIRSDLRSIKSQERKNEQVHKQDQEQGEEQEHEQDQVQNQEQEQEPEELSREEAEVLETPVQAQEQEQQEPEELHASQTESHTQSEPQNDNQHNFDDDGSDEGLVDVEGLEQW
uniref:Sorting nexin-4 n=1 Tax=Komagataella pastoris TaxID=4922 RepID=SNX4_PICPA|nr:RecName: Full=Sorting nexin-4; AltName: Full=Autophagy-related protein 24; AltName: Full=Pexophagy zeocin-resistant mutant protein 16 [Komagataella pastoris]BAD89147.1 PpAtg24 [Komagataella pastoris]